MTIAFHCEHCGKKIKVPDSTGGKWGKCPACHNKLHVPSLDSDEELKLAPIDEDDITKQKQLAAEAHKLHLMAETYTLTDDNLPERENQGEPAEAAMPASQISDKELTKNIITYLRQMADGELDGAQTTADMIVPSSTRAVKIIDKMALSEMPEPELADIPQHVLSSLIRNLRTRIS